MKENQIDTSNSSIPKGRVERWHGGYKTIVGQDEGNRGKILGVVTPDDKFYPLEDREQFIQKPLNDPKPFVRQFDDTDIPFDEWVSKK